MHESLLKDSDEQVPSATPVTDQNIVESTKSMQLTYTCLLKNPRVAFGAMTSAVMALVYGCVEPTLNLRLGDYQSVTQVQQGLIFGGLSLAYMIVCLLTPYAVPKYVEKRVTLISSLTLLGFASFLTGPFYTELNLPVMLTGLLLIGAFLGPLYILSMPEMMVAT